MDSKNAVTLTGANQNNNRRKLDSYPTPASATIALLDFLRMPKNTVVWEPACGDGYMSRIIKNYGYQTIETDIIKGQDFLQADRVCDAIITNPPFNISDLFIKKAVNDAPLVAMLLKSQYWHAAKRISLFKDYQPAFILPITWRLDFYEYERKPGETGRPTMETCWNVWIKDNDCKTVYLPLEKPYDI